MKTGILLINLGTPDSPVVKDVRKYLTEFLNDPRVIDVPWLKRTLLVNGLIVPLRAPKSAKEYQKLFDRNGGQSPLLSYGYSLQKKVQSLVSEDITVELAMRYGSPSMDNVLEKMKKESYDKIIIFPLYPHYAASSTGSIIEKSFRIINKWWAVPSIEVIGQFYSHPRFIDCFVKNTQQYDVASFDHVLFSYHGLPVRQLDKAHKEGQNCASENCEKGVHENNNLCYKAACYETTKLLVKGLGLSEEKYSSSFQSRLGKTPWIEPYTDKVIEELAKKGVKKLLVLSPAFVADCLETLVEIQEEYQNLFIKHGGEKIQLVESLNDSDNWAEAVVEIMK